MNKTTFHILALLGAAHCINDTLQSVIAATYPLLKDQLDLNFAQIGLITLCYQLFASILQPIFGLLFDRYPSSRALMAGMISTSVGVVCLSYAQDFVSVLLSVMLFGIGSSIFHPEASRLASLASGGKRGLAQSLFQVGGNLGGALGPLLVALILTDGERTNILYCLLLSSIALFIMGYLRKWVITIPAHIRSTGRMTSAENPLNKRKTIVVLLLLLVLIASKYIYMETIRSYYTFYLIETFGISIQSSQIALFVFLFATALGTLVGGFVGDKIGRKKVIWYSIAGAAPFALLLPYANLGFSYVLTFFAGFMLSSAFPAIVVYAQELLPRKVGLVSGLFFGFAFGIAGIASAVLGYFIDVYGLHVVYHFTSFTPLLGVVAWFLPNLNVEGRKK